MNNFGTVISALKVHSCRDLNFEPAHTVRMNTDHHSQLVFQLVKQQKTKTFIYSVFISHPSKHEKIQADELFQLALYPQYAYCMKTSALHLQTMDILNAVLISQVNKTIQNKLMPC